jgi:hypothetical protein
MICDLVSIFPDPARLYKTNASKIKGDQRYVAVEVASKEPNLMPTRIVAWYGVLSFD